MVSPRRVEPILVITLYIFNRLTVSLNTLLKILLFCFYLFFGKYSLDLNYIITLNSQKKNYKLAIHIYIHVHHYIYFHYIKIDEEKIKNHAFWKLILNSRPI